MNAELGPVLVLVPPGVHHSHCLRSLKKRGFQAKRCESISDLRSWADPELGAIVAEGESIYLFNGMQASDPLWKVPILAICPEKASPRMQGKLKALARLCEVAVLHQPLAEDSLLSITQLLLEKRRAARQAKCLRDELDSSKRSESHARRTRSSFLANMSHEIRSPLNAIVGFAEILTLPNQSYEDQFHAISAIKRNSANLTTLISDLLDLAKVESGNLKVEKNVVDLASMLDELSENFLPKAVERNLEFCIIRSGALPETFETDYLRLKQVVWHLVANAFKFTSVGRISIRVRSDEETGFLSFTVEDSGKGMPSEQVKRLFENFAQADDSTTRKQGGVGLGLALSRHLARLLGGVLRLDYTRPNLGTSFTLEIDPLDKQEAARRRQSNSASSTLPHRENYRLKLVSDLQERKKLDGLRVLVVDDLPDNQALVSRYLRMAGADVELAHNGYEGIIKTANGHFDVVLMDLQMPVMDGYEAVRTLRNQGYDKPVIALTAHALQEQRHDCLNCGFDEHLAKPIEPSLLFSTLSRYNKVREPVYH